MIENKNSQRSYTNKTIKILYGRAAGLCSKCKCRLVLFELDGEQKQIGEIAHIYPFGKVDAPRYNEIIKDGFDEKNKNEYSNLILLCPKCHKEVDELPKTYTAKKLVQLKNEHESWVSNSLEERISNISYTELDVICKAIACSSPDYIVSQNYSPVDIFKKIEKNNLSNQVCNLITQGMLKTKFVHDYLNNQYNAASADNLIKCIREIYRQESQKASGDELFMSILEKMNAGITQDFSQQAAGIAVLTYFFHICEIFEK